MADLLSIRANERTGRLDLPGFTALGERRAGAEVVAILGRVDEALVDAVCEHGGRLDTLNGLPGRA